MCWMLPLDFFMHFWVLDGVSGYFGFFLFAWFFLGFGEKQILREIFFAEKNVLSQEAHICFAWKNIFASTRNTTMCFRFASMRSTTILLRKREKHILCFRKKVKTRNHASWLCFFFLYSFILHELAFSGFSRFIYFNILFWVLGFSIFGFVGFFWKKSSLKCINKGSIFQDIDTRNPTMKTIQNSTIQVIKHFEKKMNVKKKTHRLRQVTHSASFVKRA